MNNRWILITIFLLFLSSCYKTPYVDTYCVKKEGFELSITSRGRVEAIKEFQIKSKIAGVIQEVKVCEGSLVKKGEILLKLDKTEYLARLKEIEMDRLAKDLEIKEAERNLKENELNLKNAKRDYETYKELYELKAIAKNELEKFYVQYQLAQVAYSGAKDKIESKRNIREAISSDWVKQQLAWTEIKAPISGKVIKVSEDAKKGLPISIGTYLFTIIDPSSYRIKARIDEVDISKCSPLQEAIVKVDAYPNLSIKGKISKISSSLITSSESGIRYFEITLNINHTNLSLLPDMQCDVEIREKIDNVLKIPLEAIVESEGKRYVFVVKGNKVVKREIKTSLENAMEACVLSGLYENEKIVLNPPQDLNDKDTVVIKD
ncbi:MAG: efflux RND transporter periplasmic adaptor subunit [bacterium]